VVDSIRSTLGEDLDRAITSYLMGVGIVAGIVSIPYLLIPAPFLWAIGLFLGLPVLLPALLVVVVFRSSIHRHLFVWCCLAPFLMLVFLAGAAHAFILVGLSFGHIMAMPFAQVMVFVGATGAAYLFYTWTRKGEERISETEDGYQNNVREVRP